MPLIQSGLDIRHQVLLYICGIAGYVIGTKMSICLLIPGNWLP